MSFDEDNIQNIFNQNYGISVVFADACWRYGMRAKSQPSHYIVFYNGNDLPVDQDGNIDEDTITVIDDVDEIFPAFGKG